MQQQTHNHAGFWIRFIAYLIDSFIVSLIVFPIALVLAIALPQQIELSVPLDILTTTTVVEQRIDNGKTTTIIKKDVLGLKEYYFKKVSETVGETKQSNTTMIDHQSKLPISMMTSSDLGFYFFFIYMILLEGSVLQASLGKKILKLKVVSEAGEKIAYSQAIARNLLKILSGIILFIGFMMVGWTIKKQALHDKISKTLVIYSN